MVQLLLDFIVSELLQFLFQDSRFYNLMNHKMVHHFFYRFRDFPFQLLVVVEVGMHFYKKNIIKI